MRKTLAILSLGLLCTFGATAQQGAFATGKYRNLFLEAGHSQPEIHNKIDAAFQQLFHGDPKVPPDLLVQQALKVEQEQPDPRGLRVHKVLRVLLVPPVPKALLVFKASQVPLVHRAPQGHRGLQAPQGHRVQLVHKA